jgi:hypothetical protein
MRCRGCVRAIVINDEKGKRRTGQANATRLGKVVAFFAKEKASTHAVIRWTSEQQGSFGVFLLGATKPGSKAYAGRLSDEELVLVGQSRFEAV